MLAKLYIKNFILIEEISLHFDCQLNIITGETGAGKSILLGALGLLMGQRAEGDLLYNKNEKSILEALYTNLNHEVNAYLVSQNLDQQPELIVRREINTQGVSRALINDTPVTLLQLKQLSQLLFDLHQQHDSLLINQSHVQLAMLDAFCQHGALLQSYQFEFSNYQLLQKQYLQIEKEEQLFQKEYDYIKFQWNEIEEAQIVNEDEWNEIETELKLLENSHVLQEYLNELQALLHGGQGLNTLWQQANKLLQKISKTHTATQNTAQRFESLNIEWKDLIQEIDSIELPTPNASKLQWLEEKHNLITRLLKKHQVNDIKSLMLKKEQFEEHIQRVENFSDIKEKVSQQILNLETSLNTKAKQLHKQRCEAIPKFSENITKAIQELAMPSAVFDIRCEVNDTFQSNGKSNIQFLLSANKGQIAQELKKTASGGELARVVLALKSLMAAHLDVPTLLFDEIDTGISGETALHVGKLLQNMSTQKQVICITHLPQIASRNAKHWVVSKTHNNEKTQTFITPLEPKERVVEIAKLLSGNNPSKSSMIAASELLELQ